jgi:N6-L-threonylcarbamoyladenine synthase
MPDAYILGIESSCDETAAAVVRSGEQLISNVVASQIATHQPYGGVVPELASREHLRAIVPVVRQALAEANHTYNSVDAIAVTQGPGLAGALLVGISYAKALAFALDKPLIAVNHLEGHIHAVLLEERQKGNHDLQFPVLALVVSGGHTHLYLAAEKDNSWTYENIGHTRDDAAGEAFDKVAKHRSSTATAAADMTDEWWMRTTTVPALIFPTAASRPRSFATSKLMICAQPSKPGARPY